MKLAMEHLSKQFKNKIAVKQIDTILTEGVYGFGVQMVQERQRFYK